MWKIIVALEQSSKNSLTDRLGCVRPDAVQCAVGCCSHQLSIHQSSSRMFADLELSKRAIRRSGHASSWRAGGMVAWNSRDLHRVVFHFEMETGAQNWLTATNFSTCCPVTRRFTTSKTAKERQCLFQTQNYVASDGDCWFSYLTPHFLCISHGNKKGSHEELRDFGCSASTARGCRFL